MSFPVIDPRDLFAHRTVFQIREGFPVGPMLDPEERKLWKVEYQRDCAQLRVYQARRRAEFLVEKSRRRAAAVPHGMATRSKQPIALPSKKLRRTARMSTGGIAPRRPENVPDGD